MMREINKQSLASRLKDARTIKEISQQKLAKLSNVHYTNIGRYERGNAIPSADVLNRIAKALELNSDYLMNGSLDNKVMNALKDERLLIQYKKIEQLPEEKKMLLIEFLDGFIFKSDIHQQLGVK